MRLPAAGLLEACDDPQLSLFDLDLWPRQRKSARRGGKRTATAARGCFARRLRLRNAGRSGRDRLPSASSAVGSVEFVVERGHIRLREPLFGAASSFWSQKRNAVMLGDYVGGVTSASTPILLS
jgi:hypothetical protein